MSPYYDSKFYVGSAESAGSLHVGPECATYDRDEVP